MNKWSIGGLVLTLAALAMQFIGDGLAAKGQEEELMADLEERYVLVPRNPKNEE